MRFDYFYGQEVEQYTFLRVPKTLFTDPYYYELSNEAKLLYSMMLERMQLSIANGWFDEKNRAFIYYKAKTIMNDMHCHSQKCAKLISELEAIGLIQKEKQGLGMPDRIYVMNFATMLDQEMDMHAREKETEDEGTEEDEIPDIPNSHLQRCENQIPEDVKNKAAEIRKTKPNNTEYSNTENNNLINHICRRPDESPGTDEIDKIDKIDEMIHTIKGKLEYDFFAKQKDGDSKQYCELCNLILDTVSINRQSVRIDKEDIPINAVRKRFLMLTQDSIRYVQLCLSETTTRIGNIRNYLLTALYHAPETQSAYFEQRVKREQ